MKLMGLAIATFAVTIGLATPTLAQRVPLRAFPVIRSDSQDFFRWGQVQFEREIEYLVWRSDSTQEDLLKIEEFPPLKDGPFSVEQSNTFPNSLRRFDSRAIPSQSDHSMNLRQKSRSLAVN